MSTLTLNLGSSCHSFSECWAYRCTPPLKLTKIFSFNQKFFLHLKSHWLFVWCLFTLSAEDQTQDLTHCYQVFYTLNPSFTFPVFTCVCFHLCLSGNCLERVTNSQKHIYEINKFLTIWIRLSDCFIGVKISFISNIKMTSCLIKFTHDSVLAVFYSFWNRVVSSVPLCW